MAAEQLDFSEAISSILRREIAAPDEVQISFERIADEAQASIAAVAAVDWSDDPVSTPECRAWQNLGWKFIGEENESLVLRRSSVSAGFVSEGGALP